MSLPAYVFLYLALTMLTGLAAGRLIHNSGDFINANRRLPFMLSSLALFALWYGSETVFGASAEFIEHGLLGVIEDPFGGFLCLVLFGLLLVRPLYRRNLLTLGDLFRQAYGSRTEYLASLCMLLTFVGYIAAQLVALSILFETVFGIDAVLGRVLSAMIVTTYTAVGGMWAVSITDFVQSIVIVGGLALLAVYFSGEVDMDSVFMAPQPHFFDFVPSADNGRSWLEYAAAWCTLGLGSLASQDIFQRANAARSERIAVWSTLFGAGLYLLFAMLPLYLGLLLFQMEPALLEGDRQYALMQLVAGHAPFWLQVMFYGALISAIFSTCSGALLAPATILAENFIKPLLLPRATDKALLCVSRLSVVLMAMFAVGLTFLSDNIYDLVAESSILGAVSILVPMLFALFARRHSVLGAQLALSLGLLAYLLAEYVLASPIPPLFIGIAASLLGMLLGRYVLPATSGTCSEVP
jgi:solute:Na+ symporter, SSS family